MKILAQHFYPSWDSYLNQAINGESDLVDLERTSKKQATAGFNCTDSFETAYDLAIRGWRDGLTQIKKLTKELRPEFLKLFPKQDHGYTTATDVQGSGIEIANYLAGQPDCMITMEDDFSKIKLGSKLQRIVVETVCSCAITPETLFFRGAVICAAIEAMELVGFRVEVIQQVTIESNKELLIYSTVIKSFDQHTDYDRLAFALCNGDNFRRLGFSIMEQEPEEHRKKFHISSNGHYGYPYSFPVAEQKDIYLPHIQNNKTKEELVKEMLEMLKKRFSVADLWEGIDEHNKKNLTDEGNNSKLEDDSDVWEEGK